MIALFLAGGRSVSRTLSGLQALALGAIVLAALLLGVAGVFSVGSRGWYGKDALHVRSGFKEIRGVEVGTRVRIQGIDAGEVVQILPPDSPDGNVILRLRLKGDYRHLVRGGSEVQILSEGMIGGKVVEIRPPRKKPGESAPDMTAAVEDAMLASAPSSELSDVLGEVGSALKGIQTGEGTLGKLAKDPRAYEALVGLIQNSTDAVDRSKDAMAAIQRDAEALKKVPIIGGYVEDPVALLVRGNCERNRRTFSESELFESGRAVLTAKGREKLDELGPWLSGLKHKGSEIVVVAYADPTIKAEAKTALNVTRQQSEAVVDYLKKQHSAHKLGWFSSRKVVALGQGVNAPPVPEREPLPPARVEVVVFVPQS
jgi:phospholipid/cholesterol/gamma-HCH transport system substrate-binding protein